MIDDLAGEPWPDASPNTSNIDLGEPEAVRLELETIPRMMDAALAPYPAAAASIPALKRQLRLEWPTALERFTSRGYSATLARAHAERECRQLRFEIETAETTVAIAQQVHKSLESRLSAAQTRARFLMAAMNLER